MKVAASILSILSGLLQIVICIALGAGRLAFNDPIEKLFYSDGLFIALSCLMILFGALALKYTRVSGAALVLLGTSSFFLGSLLFAPLAVIGGAMALAAPATSLKNNSLRYQKIYLWLTVLGFLGIVAGNLTAIYIWNKAPEKVEDVKGISITADELTRDYTADEAAADAKYLNKAIEVSGTVVEVINNQDGGTMVILKSIDPTTAVQCALRDKTVKVAEGQQIVIKGFCSGNGITGVSLTDCVIK
jgi:hypothetical protein